MPERGHIPLSRETRVKQKIIKGVGILATSALVSLSAGCGPALIGGGAVGAWSVGTDERTIGRMWDDAGIGAKVKAALLSDSLVGGMGIDVDVVDGVVYLNGTVDSAKTAAHAASVARGAAESRGLTNNLAVGEKSVGQSLDDKVIGGRVWGRLVGEPGLRSMNIDVDVERGVVTLTGKVASVAQKRRVVELARGVEGVARVKDFLKVK